MTTLIDIACIEVPRSITEEANAHLRIVGEQGLEGFSLWAGKRIGSTFCVKKNIVPAQTGHRTPRGVCVSVNGDELHRINLWLYENGMTLIAQLHSHPTDAFHSDTDDAFPIATTLGCLSIVIPDFARHPFTLARCAVYRLLEDLNWTFVEPNRVKQLIKIIED
jgi:hypothetical protein